MQQVFEKHAVGNASQQFLHAQCSKLLAHYGRATAAVSKL
jgi:hypothetical protein